tara:strand:+ start:986 stop:1186 length:201 start_codon:yes stop_codon:yes gene_type:complete
MAKIIDIEKYKKEKEIGTIRAEHYFTLDEVEEIAWEFLQTVLSEEELQEISWRIEQLTKENEDNER